MNPTCGLLTQTTFPCQGPPKSCMAVNPVRGTWAAISTCSCDIGLLSRRPVEAQAGFEAKLHHLRTPAVEPCRYSPPRPADLGVAYTVGQSQSRSHHQSGGG